MTKFILNAWKNYSNRWEIVEMVEHIWWTHYIEEPTLHAVIGVVKNESFRKLAKYANTVEKETGMSSKDMACHLRGTERERGLRSKPRARPCSATTAADVQMHRRRDERYSIRYQKRHEKRAHMPASSAEEAAQSLRQSDQLSHRAALKIQLPHQVLPVPTHTHTWPTACDDDDDYDPWASHPEPPLSQPSITSTGSHFSGDKFRVMLRLRHWSRAAATAMAMALDLANAALKELDRLRKEQEQCVRKINKIHANLQACTSSSPSPSPHPFLFLFFRLVVSVRGYPSC